VETGASSWDPHNFVKSSAGAEEEEIKPRGHIIVPTGYRLQTVPPASLDSSLQGEKFILLITVVGERWLRSGRSY